MTTPAPSTITWGKTPAAIVAAFLVFIGAIVGYFNGPGTPTPTPTVTVTASASVTPTPSPTPTPTPTPTVTVHASFPDASTTGWAPTGVTLTQTAGMTITTPGTVIDSKDIRGNVTINADNVTIKRSRITAGGWYPVSVTATAHNFQLIDSEVVGLNSPMSRCSVNVTGSAILLRVDLHDCEDGVHPGDNSTITDSYIHDLCRASYVDSKGVTQLPHNDGIQEWNSNVRIVHNTIDIGHGENGAVFIKADFGAIDNVTVDHNYVNGGVYTVYGSDTTAGKVTNVTVTNNTFGPGAVYGLLIASQWAGPVTLAGNIDATGKSVP